MAVAALSVRRDVRNCYCETTTQTPEESCADKCKDLVASERAKYEKENEGIWTSYGDRLYYGVRLWTFLKNGYGTFKQRNHVFDLLMQYKYFLSSQIKQNVSMCLLFKILVNPNCGKYMPQFKHCQFIKSLKAQWGSFFCVRFSL